jgi:hypothetical protein
MNEKNTNRELTVVVLSCDKYKDLWPVFARYFKAYWGNCPYRVCLLTNEESFQEAGIASLQTGKDVGWSDSLISALNQIDSKFVLFLFDDIFPCSFLRNDIIVDAISFLERVGGTCVRLRSTRFPLIPVPNEPAMGRLSTRLPYRNALPISIWDRVKLLTYLKPGESAWDFETKANFRTECDEKIYAIRQDHFNWIHAVVKGRWFRGAYHKVVTEIPEYTASRPVMSVWEQFLMNAYTATRRLFITTFGVRAFKAFHKIRWSV